MLAQRLTDLRTVALETVLKLPLRTLVSPSAESRHDLGFIDVCGLASLKPEEEPESRAEVRSQWRQRLPSVGE
jgi:hypothetical protein